MQDYFESEILRTEQELTDLKTSQQKFAGEVPLITKSINVSVPLHLSSGGFMAEGNKIYKVTLTKDAIFVPTLAWYYTDVSLSAESWQKTRWVDIYTSRYTDNVFYVRLYIVGTNYGDNNDVYVLDHGGSVSVDNVLTVQSTADFTLEAL